MKLQGPFTYGKFIERPNRFLAICRLSGRRVPAYIPNPGPMPDLLFSGVEVLLRHNCGNHRKTDFDLICSRNHGVLLSLDSRVPNWLLAEVLPQGLLMPFSEYHEIITEPVYHESRLDFLLLADEHPPFLIETKSSTDAFRGVGLFPRAVTKRGYRHVQELIYAVKEGYRAAIVFIVQRTDAKIFRPNDQIDPAFGNILRQAADHGVETYAWTTQYNEQTHEILISKAIPVDLSPPESLK